MNMYFMDMMLQLHGNHILHAVNGVQGLLHAQGLQGVQGLQHEQGLQGMPHVFDLQDVQGVQGMQHVQGVLNLQHARHYKITKKVIENQITIIFKNMISNHNQIITQSFSFHISSICQ